MSLPALLRGGVQRILFVLAHPDDADFLSGGTVALLAQEGHELHYLLVTRGDKGSDDPTMTATRLASIREREQEHAAKVLGVQTLTFLDGYSDSEVEPTLALRAEIALVIRQWQPSVVFTFDPWRRNEVHPDHRAVGICTLDAVACARGRMNFPEQLIDGLSPHSVRDMYYFSTNEPNHWVDTTTTIDRKIEAMLCHESQLTNFDPADFAQRKGRLAGAEHKFAFAESFHHYSL
ncbi:MAG: PIG-L family deacetylase [Ktedonobacteraceae bacterium]|nr:PIG-L family deacetylase [Ktedonobacteraceae bacterium]MBA3824703.1 PIG-L family deacetylase [Ktedonobacterales bacterium]